MGPPIAARRWTKMRKGGRGEARRKGRQNRRKSDSGRGEQGQEKRKKKTENLKQEMPTPSRLHPQDRNKHHPLEVP
ncbi:uncharacterized protein SPSK_05764 [Sporothrix schenckii 1099-18]|uniref:Uncharacterized protein n=1 Tax=Sporothrix schenckii 1099-18 TaxID=1397361 RepID=A0A0F2LRZ9_SPOSC|nr:uncharacterized protein SPSK_05764 [Sporothrix schenckii 1099-18]KJR80282.1 hypothetical protein SPSK_05764 [Sporothrix schenckii 1099-18]